MIKAASTSMLLIRTVSHENAMRLQSFSLFCLRFFQRRTPQSHTHPSIPCSLARPGETRLSLPREESLGSQDTIEFANGIVAAQHLACMQQQLLSLVILSIRPTTIEGREGCPSLFIGLAASHLIHSFALMVMVSTQYSCVRSMVNR
jgi:hypothetical protein